MMAVMFTVKYGSASARACRKCDHEEKVTPYKPEYPLHTEKRCKCDD